MSGLDLTAQIHISKIIKYYNFKWKYREKAESYVNLEKNIKTKSFKVFLILSAWLMHGFNKQSQKFKCQFGEKRCLKKNRSLHKIRRQAHKFSDYFVPS